MTKKASPNGPSFDLATTPLPTGLYPAMHFTLMLSDSENRRNVPALLRHLADTLDAMPPVHEVSDIVFHRTDVTADDDEDDLPSFTVYFMGRPA